MAEVCITQPQVFDAVGNINVHGRSSLIIGYKVFAPGPEPRTQVNASGFTVYFEVAGILRQQLTTDPNDTNGLLLTIGNLSGAGLTVGPPFPDYVFRDETGADPNVTMQGQVRITGYETAPP
jgi:hypothetical protein